MSEQVFESLRAKWRVASDKADEFRRALDYKYGTWYIHAPCGQRAKMDKLNKRADMAQEAIFAWLDAHSPRYWRSGCPCQWVCEELTYADAVTFDQLSVIPPCAYGQMPHDMIRFARAVEAKGGAA